MDANTLLLEMANSYNMEDFRDKVNELVKTIPLKVQLAQGHTERKIEFVQAGEIPNNNKISAKWGFDFGCFLYNNTSWEFVQAVLYALQEKGLTVEDCVKKWIDG